MSSKAKIRETAVLTVIAAVLTFALSSAAVQYLDIDPWMFSSYGKIFIAVITAFVLWTLIFYNKKTMIISGSIITAVAIIFLIIWLRGNFSEEFRMTVNSFMKFLGRFITAWKSGPDMISAYAAIITVGITVLISLFLYWFVVRLRFYPPVLLLALAMFISQWAVQREVHKSAFYLTIAMLGILYFTVIYFKKVRSVEKAGYGNRYLAIPSFMAVVIPVVSIALILTLIIPKSDDPIKWEWLDDRIKYRNLGGDKAIDFKSYDSFSLAATGFSSEAGRLGGTVTPDMSHMLDVYSEEPLYLRGETWPYFDGSQWGTVSDDVSYAELLVDYPEYKARRQMLLEPVYGWRFMNLYEWLTGEFPDTQGIVVLPGVDFNTVMGVHLLPDWYDVKSVEINYAGVETKTMFSPLYSELTNYDDLKPVYVETDGTLDTDRTIRLYTLVDYDYLSLDRRNPYFLKAIRQSRKGIYRDLLSRLYFISYNADAYDNIRVTNSMDNTLQDLYELSQKADVIFWRYTNLPENLPERVVDLAKEITAEHDIDYDKVSAIEDYLSDNYSYSLTVEDVPTNRNFVDWFIFDSKEGYCTYYATAMTILVRSIGLPARYVEGFATPYSATEGNRYAVLNSNAHAWTEVYFEGIGWVPFEPTSPYNLLLNNVEIGNPDAGETLLNDPAFDQYLNKLDKEDDEFVKFPEGVDIPLDKGIGTTGILSIILGAYLAFNLTVYIARRVFFGNIRTGRQFKRGYTELLRILGIKGIKIQKGETLMEHAQKIDETFYMGKVSMKDLTRTYYKLLYSKEDVSQDDISDMQSFYRDFRKEMDSELRLWEFILYRLLVPLI